jgi:hypothetical protein
MLHGYLDDLRFVDIFNYGPCVLCLNLIHMSTEGVEIYLM